jgi:SPRY domain-containing SOCS box protein 3
VCYRDPQRFLHPIPLKDCRHDPWVWNKNDKSHETIVDDPPYYTGVTFHPNWSNGTSGIRGTRVMNGGVHYWEVLLTRRVFGTSMMIGIGTKKARVHADAFINMIGEDSNSWGLSHKGFLWHAGKKREYCKPFLENEPCTVGVLVNWPEGTLTYYKDGQNLGVAFTDLDQVEEDVYPIISSTAAKTEMALLHSKTRYTDLQDRCRSVIADTCLWEDLKKLPLPRKMLDYIGELYEIVYR